MFRVSPKTKNVLCILAIDSPFVVSHLAEDNKLLQCFIKRDFSAGMSFCGSTNILKINLGIPFCATCYLFF